VASAAMRWRVGSAAPIVERATSVSEKAAVSSWGEMWSPATALTPLWTDGFGVGVWG